MKAIRVAVKTPNKLRVPGLRENIGLYFSLSKFLKINSLRQSRGGSPRFVFEADLSVSRVTYLDADLWFRKNPAPIFTEFELSGKHVLITDHAYASEYDLSATSGQYCVQFVTFVRNTGEVVRKWWEDRCIEWCFGYFEDGKFGDQMYLDDWPLRFCNEVHVLDNKELTLAPWNARRFPYGNAVFFHFHGLRIASPRKLNLGKFYLPRPVIKYVYRPYASELNEAVNRLEESGFFLQAQAQPLGVMRRALWRLTFLYRQFRQAIPKHTLRW